METILPILNDMVVILFDLLIFTRLVSLKNDRPRNRVIMYTGCAVIIGAYYVGVYIAGMPASTASALFMSVPSLILFFFLSKHRDCRFFLTFCFVDSVSLIVAFLGRAAAFWTTSSEVGILSISVTTGLYLAILIIGRRYFKQYHDLLEVVDIGWKSMMVATALIYFALLFFAAYPQPLVERPADIPVYLVFSAVVIACYVVFVHSILKTRRIYEQNKRLQREQEIFQIAYTDALTGLSNRAAYIEHLQRLERSKEDMTSICCVMLDLNRFKMVNDTMGHHMGDGALQMVGRVLRETFAGETVFRLGGDEFAVLLLNIFPAAVEERLTDMKKRLAVESDGFSVPLTMAAGYAFWDPDRDRSLDETFIRADEQMYEDKQRAVVPC